MKKKDKEEIRAKSPVELKEEIRQREKELLALKMDHSLAKLKNTSQISRKADELAVIKTILREKGLTAEIESASKGGKE